MENIKNSTRKTKNKNKSCQEPECKIHPLFNFKEENKAIYCGKHKKEGMIDVKNSKCKEDECEKRPS